VTEREKEWVIRADLPEVEQKDIDLVVSSQAIKITAPSKGSMGTTHTGYYCAEAVCPPEYSPRRSGLATTKASSKFACPTARRSSAGFRSSSKPLLFCRKPISDH
jgi:hypothetical protein